MIPESEVSERVLSEFFDGSKLTSTVGDRTTERVQQLGFQPDLEVLDLREQRSGRSAPKPLSNQLILRARNEPGSISSDAIDRIIESLRLIRDRSVKVRLVIDGEEDLLVLPVAVQFPENTVIFYGQPNEGLVVVSSKASKERLRKIMSDLGISLTL